MRTSSTNPWRRFRALSPARESSASTRASAPPSVWLLTRRQTINLSLRDPMVAALRYVSYARGPC